MSTKKAHEDALRKMLDGWMNYALAHQEEFDRCIGDDCVLGPAWKQIGVSLRTLLNGETGALDCGRVDGAILDVAKHNSANIEE